MDHLDKLYETSKIMLPWSTFLIGFIGSVHCAGMCGGLVMSCSPTMKHNAFYQLGRLFSYSLLAALSGVFGNYFQFTKTHPVVSIIPGLLIGGMLMWFGVKHFLSKKADIKLPKLVDSLIHKVWGKILPKAGKISKKSSFLIGSFSIALPCGLLYGVILSLAAFSSPVLSLLCIFTFWIGTLPAMSFAPNIIKKIIKPLYQKLPLFISLLMITIGLVTIISRIYMSHEANVSCH